MGCGIAQVRTAYCTLDLTTAYCILILILGTNHVKILKCDGISLSFTA
jgi:hypothetical protein